MYLSSISLLKDVDIELFLTHYNPLFCVEKILYDVKLANINLWIWINN